MCFLHRPNSHSYPFNHLQSIISEENEHDLTMFERPRHEPLPSTRVEELILVTTRPGKLPSLIDVILVRLTQPPFVLDP